jgi:hypothetical protein
LSVLAVLSVSGTLPGFFGKRFIYCDDMSDDHSHSSLLLRVKP